MKRDDNIILNLVSFWCFKDNQMMEEPEGALSKGQALFILQESIQSLLPGSLLLPASCPELGFFLSPPGLHCTLRTACFLVCDPLSSLKRGLLPFMYLSFSG